MKILIVTRQKRSRPFETIFKGIEDAFGEVKVVYLSPDETYRVGDVLNEAKANQYDRVLLDVPMRKFEGSMDVLARIRGLVIYEEDTWQEFHRYSKSFGQFSRLIGKLPNARLIVTGYRMKEFFQGLGVSVSCVPKAADDTYLWNDEESRDIEIGFIGTVSNRIYKKRNRLIAKVAKRYGLQIMQTEPTDEYRAALNRIRIFFSADVDFDEYMAKNFEAMRCGCLLMASRQSREEQFLGFKDMTNVVLYSSEGEAFKKIEWLQGNPEKLARIAESGEKLVAEQHLLRHRIPGFVKALSSPPLDSAALRILPSHNDGSSWRRFLRRQK